MIKKLADFIERHHRRFRFPVVLMMTFVSLVIKIDQPAFLERIELASLDMRFKFRGPISADPRIVVLAIDDNSLAEYGRWPWSRDLMAKLVDLILGRYGAAALGFDIIFSEAQRNPLEQSLQLLQQTNKGGLSAYLDWLAANRELGDMDGMFEHALSKYNDRIVLGYFFYPQGAKVPRLVMQETQEHFDTLFYSAIPAKLEAGADPALIRMQAVELNLPRFMEVVHGAGFFNFFPDIDGMVRRVPLVVRHGDDFYPNISLQLLRVALGWPDLYLEVSQLGVETLQLGTSKLPVDAKGEMLINHYGPSHTFHHIAAADVLAGRVSEDALRDKIVIMGATAIGVYDYRPSPFDVVFPGVEGHAATMANLLNDEALKHPDAIIVMETAGTFVLPLVCGIIALRLRPSLQGLMLVVVPLGVFGFGQWLFNAHFIWIRVVYLMLGVVITIGPLILIDYLVEARKRAFIHDAFSHFLAPAQVKALEEHAVDLQLGGEERELTAFFSDIASFSSFSEKMRPNELVHFLNLYLTEMSDIIMEQGGTIDKYEGDAIIAFFGAPLPLEDHAVRGVRAALAQQRRLQELVEETWRKAGYPAIHVRMGINSGLMVVGNMGSEQHMDYTVMGDNVNLASRLEGVNKVYGTPILISGETYHLVRESMVARFIDRVRVVGRQTPVDIYQPLGEKGEVGEDLLRLARDYEQAWRLMEDREFAAAEGLWRKLAGEYPEDRPLQVMLARVQGFRRQPPSADWDGVFALEEK